MQSFNCANFSAIFLKIKRYVMLTRFRENF
jgi:hypothetical protein